MEVVEPRQLLAAINGSVFDDANGNGRRDGSEGPLAGQTVWADYNYDGKLTAGEPSAVSGTTGT